MCSQRPRRHARVSKSSIRGTTDSGLRAFDNIADNSSAGQVVLGDAAVPPDRHRSAHVWVVVVTVDGVVADTASGAAALDDPAAAVAWMARAVARRDPIAPCRRYRHLWRAHRPDRPTPRHDGDASTIDRIGSPQSFRVTEE